MRFSMFIDDETRKQIRDALLSEVKGVSRSEIHSVFGAEMKRVGADIMGRWTRDSYTLSQIIRDQLRDLLTSRWASVAELVQELVQKQVDAAVAEKLKNKTVWEAQAQEAYIRNIVRQELRAILGQAK